MIAWERRIVVAETPADLKAREDRRDEWLRLASFAYSATVMAGQRCDYKNQTTQPTGKLHVI